MAVVPTYPAGPLAVQADLTFPLGPPSASIYANGTQVLSLTAPITFDTAAYQHSDTVWSASTNPSRMYFGTPGTYLVLARWGATTATTSTYAYLDLRKNAAGNSGGGTRVAYAAQWLPTIFTPLVLEARTLLVVNGFTDYIEMFGSLTTTGGAGQTPTLLTANQTNGWAGSVGITAQWVRN